MSSREGFDYHQFRPSSQRPREDLCTSLTIDNLLQSHVGRVLDALRDAGFVVEVNLADASPRESAVTGEATFAATKCDCPCHTGGAKHMVACGCESAITGERQSFGPHRHSHPAGTIYSGDEDPTCPICRHLSAVTGEAT